MAPKRMSCFDPILTSKEFYMCAWCGQGNCLEPVADGKHDKFRSSTRVGPSVVYLQSLRNLQIAEWERMQHAFAITSPQPKALAAPQGKEDKTRLVFSHQPTPQALAAPQGQVVLHVPILDVLKISRQKRNDIAKPPSPRQDVSMPQPPVQALAAPQGKSKPPMPRQDAAMPQALAAPQGQVDSNVPILKRQRLDDIATRMDNAILSKHPAISPGSASGSATPSTSDSSKSGGRFKFSSAFRVAVECAIDCD